MEGVYASAQALGAGGPARRARAIAETLIDAARVVGAQAPTGCQAVLSSVTASRRARASSVAAS